MADRQPDTHSPATQPSSGASANVQPDAGQRPAHEPRAEANAQAAAGKGKNAEDQLAALAKGLKGIETFRLFSEEEIRTAFLPSCSVRSFKMGERIVREGENSHVYFIIAGQVKAVRHGLTLCHMQRRGDIFGEEAIVEGSLAPATIIAVKDTTCLVMNSRFSETLKDESLAKFYSTLYRVFSEKLVERLRETSDLVLRLKEENARLKALVEGVAEQAAPPPAGG